MPSVNARFTEASGLVGVISTPAAGLTSGATTSTASIDLSKGTRFTATTIIGVLAGGASLSGFWSGSATAGGSYTALASGGFAATTVSSIIQLNELSAPYVSSLGLGYKFVKWNITVTVSAANATSIVTLYCAREEPAAGQNMAVVQTPIVLN